MLRKTILVVLILMMTITITMQYFPIAIASPNFIGEWLFNEGTGTVAYDTSISGYDGTINSCSWATGRNDDALSFSGTGDVNIGDQSGLNFGTGSFTISAWFKTSNTGMMRIVSKGSYGWTNGYFLGIGYGNAGSVSIAIGGDGQQDDCLFIYTENSYNDDSWHHSVAVIDTNTEKITIYVDGVKQAISKVDGTEGAIQGSDLNFSNASSYSASSTDTFRIGSYNGTAERFNGIIDSVRVYGNALTEVEVKNLFSSDLGITGEWLLDEGTGTVVEDTSGNNYDGEQ